MIASLLRQTILLALVISIPARADEFLRATKSGGSGGAVTLTVTTDNLSIRGITINRGNCPVYEPYAMDGAGTTIQNQLPFLLKFGDKVYITTSCDVIEIQLSTDKGVRTLSW